MEFWKINIFLCELLSLFTVVNAARILGIFTTGFKSHFSFNEGIMRILHDAGHQITIVSPFSTNDCSRNYYKLIDSKSGDDLLVGQIPINIVREISVTDTMQALSEMQEKHCYHVLKLQDIQNTLNSNSKPFDVVFVEMFLLNECFLPLAEKIDVPVIGTVTHRSWKMAYPAFNVPYNPSVGNFYHPATIPFEITSRPLPKTMSFCQRLQNTWYHLYTDLFHYFVVWPMIDKMYSEYYPVQFQYKKKVSLVFYNSHPILLPRSLVPNVIEVGGVHLTSPKPLPTGIQKFFDESSHGVIVFSLGSITNGSTLTIDLIDAFKNAFAEIPQRVIWKFESKIPDLPKNVLTLGWIPQRDILAHAKVKAFISHCGISGIYEAIYEEKPIVLIPVGGDQMTNAAILADLGVGVYVDMSSVTKEVILNSLNSVVNDTKYRDNMKNMSRIFKDRPMTPQQSVVYWTEYVMRYKGALHLRTAAADMPLHQYLLLDVILFIIITTLVTLYLTMFILRRLFSVILRNWKISTKIEKKEL